MLRRLFFIFVVLFLYYVISFNIDEVLILRYLINYYMGLQEEKVDNTYTN